MRKRPLTLSFEQKSVQEATFFANELRFATGSDYKVRSFTMGRHFVVIRDESKPKDVIGFSGTTWRDVYWNVKDAWDAFCTLRDANRR